MVLPPSGMAYARQWRHHLLHLCSVNTLPSRIARVRGATRRRAHTPVTRVTHVHGAAACCGVHGNDIPMGESLT